MKLRFTPRAQADMASIYDFIASGNPVAATRLIGHIRQTAALLKQYPNLGTQTRRRGIFLFPVPGTRYLVMFSRPRGKNLVNIVSVVHGARRR